MPIMRFTKLYDFVMYISWAQTVSLHM